MRKVTMLADLYRKAVQEYTKTPAEWKGLLACVARFYKRSFDNAVLIYVQKPNATQLGTWDDWHDERIGRSINRGARSIAVIDMQNPGASLKHLFDFMDTNGTEESFKKFMRYHWELEEQYCPSLMMRFHEKYAAPMSGMEACLFWLINKRVEEILPKYMEHFRVREDNSPLFGMPEEAVKAEFKEIVTASVAYTVFSKCGLPTENIDDSSFENISLYRTLGMFMSLGSCTVSVTRPILKEIYQEIEAIKSERSQIYESRTFDESQLHRGRGRDDVSRTADLRGKGQNARGQVRGTMEEVHDGEPSAPPVGADSGGSGKQNNPESGRGSTEPQGGVDPTAFENPADAQYREYDEESWTHEQPDNAGRGNRHERTGAESQIVPQETKDAEPPMDGHKPSAGGLFAVSPKSHPKPLWTEDKPGLLPVPVHPQVTEHDIGLLEDEQIIGEKADLETLEELHITDENLQTETILPVPPDARQIKLFDLFGQQKDMYEDTNDGDNDGLLDNMDALKAAPYVNRTNIEYADVIIPDTKSRGHGRRSNYHFSQEHHLYDGGAKTKCRNNIAAIRLLKELQAQGANRGAARIATAEEQITLARFVGWGGLANALTPGKSGWESEYEEIKGLLTEAEFHSAQESTLTSFYTDQEVIKHIYRGLERFGFRGGNILDPAMGTGNFYSVLPESMDNSKTVSGGKTKLYGVELDTISGEIAKQLYPEAEIQIKGFEQTYYPDHFFDVVIGNIPFNAIRVDDPRYNRHGFRIHDYFLAKSLDLVRPGGIVAVITSKYTMDKANSKVRKYLAQRAKLLGAIRLPNNAFKAVAGTEATADILFLQKREREIIPDEENSPWLSIEENRDGIPLNTYFIEHPEMVLGQMVFDESMFGNEKTTACHPIPGEDLYERLERAVSYLDGEYHEADSEYAGEKGTAKDSLPADPSVRNYSYTIVEDAVYFQENSKMYLQDITGRKAERIRGMVEITRSVRSLIDFQNQQAGNLPSEEYEARLQEQIRHLNMVYDRFVKEYGYLNSYGNVIAFSRDSNAPLLRSIEKEYNSEGGQNGLKEICFEKSAMFFRATIKPKIMHKVVFSAEEALKVSLNIKGRVDLPYMAGLYQMPNSRKATPEEIIVELGDALYQDPEAYSGNPLTGWMTAGEYLSGYVKEKLKAAIRKAEEEPERFARNVEALKTVQPDPLTPQDISFALGTPWIPVDVYQDFMYETFKTSNDKRSGRNAVKMEFSEYSGAYFIKNKRIEKFSVIASQTYGTGRMNAYEILEASLNQQFVEVKDRLEYVDENGEDKVKYVLNKKETILAREKQAQMKAEFERWLFADPERGARLTNLYNDKFNNVRPRQYNGTDLFFPDMSEEIQLRPHQRDAIAHGLYGDGNLLMAHEVGAGKTYAAIALAYEMKRLGKAHKPLFAVPNHLVGQWADAYMALYPNANILVAEKKDFQKKYRRRFAGRIAAGDYDAIIMAHSSFELIGLSRERQLAAMQTELDAVTAAINEQKDQEGQEWSLKQMLIFRKNLQFRYDTLFHADKKDDVINFEELGVDALIVDEAHAYKNNFSYTKMRNVAGVSSTSSQRAMDMYQKCQYINEIGGGKGVIYLTGTPVSNTMAEMYVLQKTLQPQELEQRGLLLFDAWAATFGKVVSSLEIKPEGSGYQMKNRFAQFHNLPELMNMFSLIADIKTADMLDLPTPNLKNGEVQVVKTACTPEQKRIVMELAERAENIRNGTVDSSMDNFLKLTHEARLLSIDPRALDPDLPNDPLTKLNICARNAAQIYHNTTEQKLTQLIFCDQGTPKYDETFTFYEAMKAELIAQGIKSEEIAFIHDAKTDVQREQLFEKVRNGEIRILMGSTEKMGTGVNVQDKLIALHHLDVPWRPSDLTQRNGRILRQGNENEEVFIFNYITENTFDAYLWQILEQKQRYISQIMTGRSALRSCEDLDEAVLQYAEFKALATSDPRVKEKMEVDNEISRLMVLKSAWQSQRNDLQYKITRFYPSEIARAEQKIKKMSADMESYAQNKPEEFQMVIDGKIHKERTKAAEHFLVHSRKLGQKNDETLMIGSYAGFSIRLIREYGDWVNILLCGNGTYQTELGNSELGNITRIENLAQRIRELKENEEHGLENLIQQLTASKEESEKPFPDEDRLMELQQKKVSLDLALEFKEDGDDVMAEDDSKEESPIQKQGFLVMANNYKQEEQNYER